MSGLDQLRRAQATRDKKPYLEAPVIERAVLELAERVEGIATIIGVVKEREAPPLGLAARIEVIEGNIREALAEIVGPDEDEPDDDLPDGGEGTS